MAPELDDVHEIIQIDSELNKIRDYDILLERVLLEARRVVHADAGSIYVKEGDVISIKFAHNDTKQKSLPPGEKQAYPHFSIPINDKTISGYVAMTGEAVNIPDVYNLPPGLPFSYNTAYDAKVNYKTTSMLTVPLKSQNNVVLGVIQIINAMGPDGRVEAFTEQDESLVTHFAANATVALSGQNEELQTAYRSLLFALGLAAFLVYLVMAAQFESLVHPFIIIFTVPLGAVGAVLGLAFTATPVSVMVFIGIIILVGIVVNNAIVLVDYANQLRTDGMSKREALVTAGQVRLRPILMTTLTTVLGLLPMSLGFGEGAEIRAPMAITVMSGLMFSTLLTLIVIPVVYEVVDRRVTAADQAAVAAKPEPLAGFQPSACE